MNKKDQQFKCSKVQKLKGKNVGYGHQGLETSGRRIVSTECIGHVNTAFIIKKLNISGKLAKINV